MNNKLKKANIKLSVAIVALVTVSVLGLGKLVLASNLFSWENVEDKVAQNLTEKALEDAGQPVEEKLGALTSPDIGGNWLRVGGVKHYFLSSGMNAASTTLCSFPNPNSATSSLISFTYQITTGTSTAATLIMATSTSAYATTTASAGNLITAQTVASGATDSAKWTPAVGTNYLGSKILGTEYVLLKTEGAGLGGYTYTGRCTAEYTAF
jgi:hypothetical protein